MEMTQEFQIKEYLKIVLDMEKNLYIQNKLLESMKLEFDSLAAHAPVKPVQPEEPKGPELNGAANIIKWFIISAICAGIAAIEFLDAPSHPHGNLVFIGVVFSIASLIFLVKGLSAKNDNNAAEKKYMQQKNDYDRNTRAFIAAAHSYAATINKLNTKRQCLKVNYSAIEKQKKSSEDILAKLYSANIIMPKYRNLISVSSIFEYFDTGRCNRLEGHDGAYNLFESEIRLDRIILKLDNIIEQLDRINENQFTLYSEIVDANRRTEKVLNSVEKNMSELSTAGQAAAKNLSDIKANEQIIAYNTERAMKELEYYNRMRYLLGDYDKIWNNRLP